MSSGATQANVIQYLQALAAGAPSDVELLARYARGRDEAAFAEVVRRYGGLVFGVARRQSGHQQQAEDVFQATFLALARSAGRLGREATLANWLYTVALRQARKARVLAARRTEHERTRALSAAPPSDPLAEISGRELLRAIDEELARLPDKHRLPVLLCCVQGLSREEAARQLGWSSGSVKGRLERGRQRLAERLAERGLAPAALVLAPSAAVTVPTDLLARTAALAAAPWSRTLPAAVRALAAYSGPRRFLFAAVLVCSLAVAGLTGLALRGGQPNPAEADPPPAAPAEAVAERPDDPLPAGAALRFGTSRYRQGTPIASLSVSADGKLAVVASAGHMHGALRVFDLTTGRARDGERSGHADEAVALSADGRTLAIKENNAVTLRDAASGKELCKIALPDANPRTLTGWLAFSPDGKALAVTSRGETIHLLDVEQGKVIRSFAHKETVFAVAFSPDGQLLAGGGYDSEGGTYFGRLWEVATGKELRRFSCGKGGIRTLAFAPDGKTLAGGGDDGRMRLWDVETGKEQRAFPADGYRIRSVAFAPDGKTVAAAGDAIRLYDPATGEERLHIDRKALGLHFSADGKVLTGAVSGTIHRWDAASGRPLTPQDGGESAVDQVLVTADGRRIVTRGQDGDAHLWDARTAAHLRRLNASWQRGIALSPDGRLLAWPTADESVKFPDTEERNAIYTGSRIRLYDIAADRFLDRFPGFKGDANELTFTPDGKALVTVEHRDGTVRVWNVATGKEVRSFRVVREDETKKRYYVWRSALSPDGRTLAVSYQRPDNTTALIGTHAVRLWDVTTGKELHDLPGHFYYVDGLAFSPDGRFLVTGSPPLAEFIQQHLKRPANQVYVWEVATGRRVPALPDGLPIGATGAAFAPDGRTFATAAPDGAIVLWEVGSWSVRAEFRGHRDRVCSLAFTPDGRLLSGGLDTTVLAWDVRPPRPSTPGGPGAAWDDLGRAEAKPAFAAQGRLLADPAATVALLAEKIKPAEPVEAKRLAQLIADLDSPQFATRDQAARTLGDLGGQAAAVLRETAEKAESLEVRRRARDLLDAWEKSPIPPAELRGLRAVEVLEWIDTPEARRLLGAWARGGQGARLTAAAEAALRRLTRP
jgi:RNA polymerase sigma factor (sigma-70 family)